MRCHHVRRGGSGGEGERINTCQPKIDRNLQCSFHGTFKELGLCVVIKYRSYDLEKKSERVAVSSKNRLYTNRHCPQAGSVRLSLILITCTYGVRYDETKETGHLLSGHVSVQAVGVDVARKDTTPMWP